MDRKNKICQDEGSRFRVEVIWENRIRFNRNVAAGFIPAYLADRAGVYN
jgi:hypothetical protein